jgi:tetratricopeptide (TPR) repeat protein
MRRCNNRGYIRLLMGNLDAAVSDIDQSIADDPYNAWAYRNKGLWYLRTGDIANAIQLLSRALTSPDSVEKAEYYLAEAYLAKGEKSKACEHFKRSLEAHEMSKEDYKDKCL